MSVLFCEENLWFSLTPVTLACPTLICYSFRNEAVHGARNHYLGELLSLQLRAKKHFCFAELKTISTLIEELQLERRREIDIDKARNSNYILDDGWKTAEPPERGKEVSLCARRPEKVPTACHAMHLGDDTDEHFCPTALDIGQGTARESQRRR